MSMSDSISDEVRIGTETLPVGGAGVASTAWWGMACLIATEGILFVYLIFSFAYLGSQQTGAWPVSGPPSLRLALPNTGVLVASSFLLEWGGRSFRKNGNRRRLLVALGGTLVLGSIFLAVQGVEWADKPFDFSTDSYSAAYFILTGTHMAHVAVGVLMLAVLLFWTARGRLSGVHHEHIPLGTLYWHFVDVVWLCVFTTVYLVPRLS